VSGLGNYDQWKTTPDNWRDDDDDCPKCDTCGAPVTTGLMAAFCPRFRECEFYVPELDEFISMDWTPPFPNAAKP
jgi:hypothetical protein